MSATPVQAPGCDDLLPVCDVVEEMKKMEVVKAGQEQYGTKKPAGKRGPAKQTFKRQQVGTGVDDFYLDHFTVHFF